MSTDVISSGTTTVSGATSTTFIVLPTASLVIGGSGSVSNALIVGGSEIVFGSANGTIVSGGGSQIVLDGGTATGTTIEAGCYQGIIDASVVDTLLAGYQQVLTGATAYGTTITSGGYEYIGNGGTTVGTEITSAGFQYVDTGGIADGTAIDAGGIQALFGSADSTAVGSGAFDLIAGTSTNAVVSGGGTATVQFGGTATGTHILAGGYAYAIDGTFTNTTVNGSLLILNGAASNGTVIGSGGDEYIGHNGVSHGASIGNHGLQYVDNGGSATNATVNGGFQFVGGGAQATGTTVNSGEEYVLGTSSNTILAVGVEEVAAGGTQNNVTFTGTPASLYLASTANLTGPVSGFSVGDSIDFLNQIVSGASFDGSILAVTTGSSTFDISLANVEKGTELVVATDGNGGTAVTLALLSQASAGVAPVSPTWGWSIPSDNTPVTQVLAPPH